MFPSQGREMLQVLFFDLHALILEDFYRFSQIHRVPENNGRDHQIESLCASLLLRMRTILDAPVPIEKDGAGQRIAGFSFVQPNLDPSAQFYALQPFQRKERFL